MFIVDCLEIEKRIQKGLKRPLIDVADAAVENQRKMSLTENFSITLSPNILEARLNPLIRQSVVSITICT